MVTGRLSGLNKPDSAFDQTYGLWNSAFLRR